MKTPREGRAALAAFCLLTIVGVITLFSQGTSPNARALMRAHDHRHGDPLEEVIPAAVDAALPDADRDEERTEERSPKRLLLR